MLISKFISINTINENRAFARITWHPIEIKMDTWHPSEIKMETSTVLLKVFVVKIDGISKEDNIETLSKY